MLKEQLRILQNNRRVVKGVEEQPEPSLTQILVELRTLSLTEAERQMPASPWGPLLR